MPDVPFADPTPEPAAARNTSQGGVSTSHLADKAEGNGRRAPRRPAWHTSPPRKKGGFRKSQIGIAWLALLALAGCFIWASSWLRPPRPCSLVLLGAGYQENLSIDENVYGWQSLADLANMVREDQFAMWGRHLLHLRQEPQQWRTDTNWKELLSTCDKHTLVVVLAVHGGADSEGPYLLPHNATPENTPQNRIRLKDVLDTLGTLPAEKNKVLILDATTVASNWELGMLHNDFARQLELLTPQIESIPRLVVMAACDADQRSWTSPELRRTIYFHFIIEGLRGGARDTENDGRIDAWELHQYVSRQVQRWTLANRGVLQTPVLLPRGEIGRARAADIDLAVAVPNHRPVDPPMAAPSDEAPEIQSWWEAHTTLANQVPSPAVYAPQLWRQYQSILMRCEQLAMAGDMNAAMSLARELQALQLGLERSRLLDLNSRQNSLVMTAACGALPPISVTAQDAVSQLWNCPEGEIAKRWNAILQAAAQNGADADLPRQVATLLYDRAVADPATNLQKVGQLLVAVEDPLFPRPTEVHFLRMLMLGLPKPAPAAKAATEPTQGAGPAAAIANLVNSATNSPAGAAANSGGNIMGPSLPGVTGLPAGQANTNAPDMAHGIANPVNWDLNAELVTLALTVRRQAARTALDAEPGVTSYSNLIYSWIAPQVEAADRLRRRGEDLIFAGPQQQTQASQLLQEAQAGYQEAWADAACLRQAYEARNQAFSILPYYAKWAANRVMLLDGTEPADDSLLVAMQQLLAQTHELDRQLQATPATDLATLKQQLQRLTEQTQVVQRGLDNLVSQSQSWWWELAPVDLPSVWHEARNALCIPQIDPALRNKLRSVYIRTSQRLFMESAQAAIAGTTDRRAAMASASNQWQQLAAQTYGRRQGAMALAVLGQYWFDRLGLPISATVASVTSGNGPANAQATGQANAAPQGTPTNAAQNAAGQPDQPQQASPTADAAKPQGADASKPAEGSATSRPATMPRPGTGNRLGGGQYTPQAVTTTGAGLPLGAIETFEEIQHRLRVFSVEQNWWVSLSIAGDQIGQRWRQMAPLIEALTAQSQNVVDWRNRRPLLEQADRLCRILPGPPSLYLSNDPAGLFRHLTTAQLLLWQAQRCWQDHWYAENPQAVPYYRVAGTIYLEDAARLTRPDAQLDVWRKKLNQPGDLMVAAAPRIDLTTELEYELEFVVQPAPGADVPDGMPVLWISTGAGLNSAVPAPDARQVRELDAKSRQGRFRCVITSPALEAAAMTPPPRPTVETSAVTAQAWFRGQQFGATCPVYLHLRPELTRVHPVQPSLASVAVRTSAGVQDRYGSGTGSVAIVLDASGSMGPPNAANAAGNFGPTFPQAFPAIPGRQPNAPTFKYAEATQALREVLSELPAGTVVSIWVFGQAMGSQKTVEDANRTIRRIQDPIVWNPQDRKQLERVMSAVSYPNLEPWNESPIVRTMLMAKQDLEGAPGFKTLVVLTDGQDNCFANDKQYNPTGLDIPTALRNAFASSGISVNIVGFKVEAHEKAGALQQFESVQNWSPPGKFVMADDVNALANLLRTAMRQRMRYWVETFGGELAPGMPGDGLNVTPNGANLQWYPGGLQPGSYLVRTQTDQPVQATIGLNRGDLLLLQLSQSSNGLQFEQAMWSKTDFPWKPFQEIGAWRMAVLQNQQMPNGGLQMLLTLEREPYATATMLQQITPREIWFEVTPSQKSPQPVAVEWSEQYGYPAPAWTINVPAWPEQESTAQFVPPQITAWWNPDQTLIPGAALDRNHDFRTLAELAGQSVQVGPDEATIESVTVEEQYVNDGQGNRQLQNCLVVRLSHRPGHPVVARVEGVRTAASENRMYSSIGKATYLFWPVTRDQVEQSLQRVLLYSVNDLKAKAQLRGYWMQLDRLPPPAASDTRPLPYDLRSTPSW